MRVRIVAKLGHTYSEPTDRSYLSARVTPAATARQHVLTHPLACEPAGYQITYDDYWGTRTVDLEILEAHERLQLQLIADVNVTNAGKPLASDFRALESDLLQANFSEFLLSRREVPTPRAAARDAVAQLRESVTRPVDLVEHALGEHVVGVGDERTHSALGLLRRVGIPARFVSGYRADPRALEPGEAGVGEFSSWIDFWDGAWHGWDPQGNQMVHEGLVIVGWGRDRGDCPPLKGIHRSPGEVTSETDVAVTRLG